MGTGRTPELASHPPARSLDRVPCMYPMVEPTRAALGRNLYTPGNPRYICLRCSWSCCRRMRWCFLHRLRAAPGGAQTPAMRARYDAGEVVEGEVGLIHSFPYTCALQKKSVLGVQWVRDRMPMQASHVVGPRGGPIGGPKCASESERFCEGLLCVVSVSRQMGCVNWAPRGFSRRPPSLHVGLCH